MYYKVYDKNGEFKEETKEFELNLEDTTYDATGNNIRPVKPIAKRPQAPLPRTKEKSSSKGWGALIVWVLIIVAVVNIGEWVIDKAKDSGANAEMSRIIGMNTQEVEAELGVTLEKNCGMNVQINEYSGGNVTVDGNGDIGVVYINGQYAGIHINSSKYSLFGVKIGDAEVHAEKSMSYEYDSYFSVLNDMAQGQSITLYYFDEDKGDCLALTYNQRYYTVASMTYFSSLEQIAKKLDFAN